MTPRFDECIQDRQRQTLVVGFRHLVEFGGKRQLSREPADPFAVLVDETTKPPLRQFQREQRITQAKVDQEIAEASLRDARLAADEDLTTQLGAFHSAEERVASLGASLAAAEEDLRVQQQRYAVGASTLLDVLSSQTQLNQARRDLIRARYDLRVAKAQLEALVGRDL